MSRNSRSEFGNTGKEMDPMTTLAPSATTTRDPKGLHFMTVVDTAYNKAGLDGDEAQRVNEAQGLAKLIANFIDENRSANLYKDEEAESRYGYRSGYTKPRDVIQQSNRLRELFLGVGFHDEKLTSMTVPTGAEGLFVIPRWQTIAPTYVEAVKIVLAKLKEARKDAFYNYRESEMTPDNLRESARKAEVMATIAEQQKGYDLLVIPAQFGLRHRGRSVRRARVVIGGSGFGLGAFEVGIMLLTHPERLAHYDDLWIDCPGDEFKPSDESAFGCAPYFRFYDDKLRFDASRVDGAHDLYGSASGSVSQ